jgi:hypothetical protein
MATPTVKIITTQQVQDLDRDTGRAMSFMRIKWRIDDQHGPYVDSFPLDGFNADAARRVLDTKAAEILKLAGK